MTSVVFVTLSCLPLHCAPAPWLAEYVRVTHAVGPPANSTTAAATGTALYNTARNFSWLRSCYVTDVSKTQQMTTPYSHVCQVWDLETSHKADRTVKGQSYLQLKHQKMDIQLQSLWCHQWGLCTTGIQSLHYQTHHLPHQGSHGLARHFEAPEITVRCAFLSSQELTSLCCALTSDVCMHAHLHAILSL